MPKTYQQELDYLKAHPHIRVEHVIFGSNAREPINVVFIAGHLRYRIVQEITRAEFMKQLRQNMQDGGGVAAEADLIGSKVDVTSAVEMAEPSPDIKYFYRAECI